MDQFIRGTVADQTGDHYRAVFHYQQALLYDSSSAFLHVALAQDYLLLGNLELAQQQLDKALRIDANHIPALELKVVMLRGRSDVAKTRECVKRLSELAPNDPRYLREMLAIALSQNDFEQADRLYRRVVEIEGETDQLIKQVLTVYLMSGQHRRAIPLLEELHRRDSTDAAIVFSLGTTHLQSGDSTKGIEFMRHANRMEPTQPRYWIGLGVLALDESKFDDAVAIMDSGIVSVGPQAGLYAIKGNALNRLGKTPEAVAALEQAIQLDSTLFSAMGTLALIYDRLDNLSRVEEYYQRAIRLSDSAAVYLNNLAYAYAQRGVQLERAKALVQQALARDPRNASYLDTMGWVEYQLGHYGDAVSWLKKAVDGEPNNAEVLEHVGDAYAKDGSQSKARKFYRHALEIDPKNEQIRRKLAP
jgi:tetratricopeptide (TPR) repeat protein